MNMTLPSICSGAASLRLTQSGRRMRAVLSKRDLALAQRKFVLSQRNLAQLQPNFESRRQFAEDFSQNRPAFAPGLLEAGL